jgi:cytochrome P450
MNDSGRKFDPQPMAAAGDVVLLPGPPPMPVIGNMGAIDSMHFHRTLEDWARQHGPLYQFRMMNRHFLATARRADISAILHNRPDQWRRTRRTTEMLEEAASRGVFTAEGDEWRRQRKLVMHALTPEVIQRFFPTMVAMTERLRLRWLAALDAGRQPDLLRDLKAYALDVTIGLAMGQDLNTLENEDIPLQRDIEFIFNRVARRLTSPVAYWRVFRLPVDRAADAANGRIQEAVAGFLAVARARLEAEPARRDKPSNMLEALLVARDAAGSGFSDATVIGNAIVMVFAGEDTTSNTMAWLIDLLSTNLESASKLTQEADSVLGTAPLASDWRRLDGLPWLDACTREAMRLKPVAPILAAEPTRDVMLGDTMVPAGMVVFMLLRHAFELDSGLGQPQQFLPARWLQTPGKEGMDDPSRKLLPFGGGPRFCPGRYLAQTEIRMVLAMLARNFVIERAPQAPVVDELFTFTMTPSTLPVLLRRRAL